MQELEQEKYHLRRRLEGVEEEYDLKVSELQTDISGLRNLLQQTEVNQRQSEREKSLLIGQLTEQNQRLTSQLKDVSPVCRVELLKYISKPILELQDGGVAHRGAADHEGPGLQQEDQHVGPCPDTGDSQGRNNHHDGEETGSGEEDRGLVCREGGSLLHTG